MLAYVHMFVFLLYAFFSLVYVMPQLDWNHQYVCNGCNYIYIRRVDIPRSFSIISFVKHVGKCRKTVKWAKNNIPKLAGTVIATVLPAWMVLEIDKICCNCWYSSINKVKDWETPIRPASPGHRKNKQIRYHEIIRSAQNPMVQMKFPFKRSPAYFSGVNSLVVSGRFARAFSTMEPWPMIPTIRPVLFSFRNDAYD